MVDGLVAPSTSQELKVLETSVGMAAGHRAVFQIALRATKPRVLLTAHDVAAAPEADVQRPTL